MAYPYFEFPRIPVYNHKLNILSVAITNLRSGNPRLDVTVRRRSDSIPEEVYLKTTLNFTPYEQKAWSLGIGAITEPTEISIETGYHGVNTGWFTVEPSPSTEVIPVDMSPVVDPCEGVVCDPTMCVGKDLFECVCQDGVCLNGALIERDSPECGYVPPTPEPVPTPVPEPEPVPGPAPLPEPEPTPVPEPEPVPGPMPLPVPEPDTPPDLIDVPDIPTPTPPMGTICVGFDLHQLVSPMYSGSIIGDLIEADSAKCGYTAPVIPPTPAPPTIPSITITIAIGIILLMVLFG